jgi:hypothetical protein
LSVVERGIRQRLCVLEADRIQIQCAGQRNSLRRRRHSHKR